MDIFNQTVTINAYPTAVPLDPSKVSDPNRCRWFAYDHTEDGQDMVAAVATPNVACYKIVKKKDGSAAWIILFTTDGTTKSVNLNVTQA